METFMRCRPHVVLETLDRNRCHPQETVPQRGGLSSVLCLLSSVLSPCQGLHYFIGHGLDESLHIGFTGVAVDGTVGLCRWNERFRLRCKLAVAAIEDAVAAQVAVVAA